MLFSFFRLPKSSGIWWKQWSGKQKALKVPNCVVLTSGNKPLLIHEYLEITKWESGLQNLCMLIAVKYFQVFIFGI